MSPDKPTEFENELADLPLRPAPPELRNQILRNAEIVEPKRSWLSFPGRIWRAPLAIRFGVAAIWLAAFCLNWATPAFEPDRVPETSVAGESPAPAPAELFAMHRIQVQQLLENDLNEIR